MISRPAHTAAPTTTLLLLRVAAPGRPIVATRPPLAPLRCRRRSEQLYGGKRLRRRRIADRSGLSSVGHGHGHRLQATGTLHDGTQCLRLALAEGHRHGSGPLHEGAVALQCTHRHNGCQQGRRERAPARTELVRAKQGHADLGRLLLPSLETEGDEVALGASHPRAHGLDYGHGLEEARGEVEECARGRGQGAVKLAHKAPARLQARHGHEKLTEKEAVEVELQQVRWDSLIAKAPVGGDDEDAPLWQLPPTAVLHVPGLQEVSRAIVAPNRAPVGAAHELRIPVVLVLGLPIPGVARATAESEAEAAQG
mmetsp:Transcript_27000/g.55858  ORF Transcript_27000/g.55858 Transcript_27000/m.55858 type:complete len:311 (-) Transcript_27000:1076-2008(-)